MMRYFLLIGVCVLCFVLPADAAFDVYLKDGKSVRVSRITFRYKEADLYPVGGSKQTVSIDQVDFAATGIERPEGVGVTLYGTSKTTKSADTFRSSAPQESSQEKLVELWNKATRTAVAVKDFGTIRQGQTVRILWNDVSMFKVLTKTDTGDISAMMVGSGDFFEYFKNEAEAKAYEDRFGPYKVKGLPEKAPELLPLEDEKKIAAEQAALPAEESVLDLALKYPLGLALVGIFIIAIVVVFLRGRS